jgi:predicted metal-dependent HD superfamily phosphohydrolase
VSSTRHWPRQDGRPSGSRSRWPGVPGSWKKPNSPGPCSGETIVPKPATLDQKQWAALWSRLGAQGSGLSIFAHLATSYANPLRSYHTAEHIRDCLAQLDLSRDTARRPDEVETAIWFHDAVYISGGADNEDRSARLAQTALAACAVPLEVCRRVAELVLATRHLTIPHEPDAQLLCDIDLSILGREPAMFDEYERRIRQEYAWVPESVYRSERSDVLAGFLRQRPIYQTEFFHQRYEEAARANLARVLEKLAG